MDREDEAAGEPESFLTSPDGQWVPPPRSRRRLATWMALVALLAGSIGAALGVAFAPRATACSSCQVQGGTDHGFASAGSKSLAAVVAAVEPSVVDINTTLVSGGAAAGTGIVLNAAGEVLTNNHVVLEAGAISVVTSRGSFSAHVVGVDPAKDVAVLQIDGLKAPLASARLGDSARIQVGEPVVALGNAFGRGTDTPAAGVVTAENRRIDATDDLTPTLEPLVGLLQTDADIQEGDSGGPLVDTAGKVIGMDTAMATEDGGDATIGFAIPINQALQIAGEIGRGAKVGDLVFGRSAFLGVEFANSTPSASSGVLVAGVTSNGPAERAGLSGGDVITAFAGTPVKSQGALAQLIARERPGQPVRVAFINGTGHHQTTVVLGATVK